MKKSLALIMVLILMVSLFAGCAKKEEVQEVVISDTA